MYSARSTWRAIAEMPLLPMTSGFSWTARPDCGRSGIQRRERCEVGAFFAETTEITPHCSVSRGAGRNRTGDWEFCSSPPRFA
jgi:hypothetical protein